MNLVVNQKEYDYTLTIQTSKLLDILIALFKNGDNSQRVKVNSWLNANTRDQYSINLGDNFLLRYLDQRDGKGSQHYWSISFNQCHCEIINPFLDLTTHEWQGLTLRSLPEIKLAQLLYKHRIPFLSNTKGLVLPSPNTFSDTILSGRVEYDFILLKPLLRIELDGKHHLNPQQRQLDISNDRTLLSLGIPTIRFNATDIINNPELVIKEILSFTV